MSASVLGSGGGGGGHVVGCILGIPDTSSTCPVGLINSEESLLYVGKLNFDNWKLLCRDSWPWNLGRRKNFVSVYCSLCDSFGFHPAVFVSFSTILRGTHWYIRTAVLLLLRDAHGLWFVYTRRSGLI